MSSMALCPRKSMWGAIERAAEHEDFCKQHRWSAWRWVPFYGIGDAYRFHEQCAREYQRWRRVLDTCTLRLDDRAINEELVARAIREYEAFDRAVDQHAAAPFVDTISTS